MPGQISLMEKKHIAIQMARPNSETLDYRTIQMKSNMPRHKNSDR